MTSSSPKGQFAAPPPPDPWRVRALNGLLIATCLLWLPAVVPGLLGSVALPHQWQLTAICIYLLLLVGTFRRKWSFQARIWIMAVAFCSAASLALANRGLVGFGRVGLTMFPLVVTGLLGSRAGWASVAAVFGIYGAFTALASGGFLQEWSIATGDPDAPIMWQGQGLGLAMAILPGVILLDRVGKHHVKLMQAERRLAEQLQEQVKKRSAAYESLRNEQIQRRRLENRMSQLAQQERRELGREIHDGLCQQLTAALLHCSALEDHLSVAESKAQQQAHRLRHLIREMLDSAYEISRGVWPMGPEPDELAPALKALTERTSSEFGLMCTFRHDAVERFVDGEVAMQLYRIAQEAVTNAVKHAEASKISVVLVRTGHGLRLEVTDDGRGIPSSPSAGGGMGMGIMSYRAHAIGGTCTVEPRDGKGTTVRCEIPASEQAQQQSGSDRVADEASDTA